MRAAGRGCAVSQPPRALLVRSGNTLYLGHTLDVPLPPEVYRELTRHMEFTHVRHLRGEEAQGLPRGRRVRTERRRCYDYDGHGCLACSSGYYDLVVERLQALGYRVRYVDDSAYFPQNTPWEWGRLKGRFTFRPKQEEALRAIEAAYRQRRGGVIDAAAGFGKSELFAAIAMMLPESRILICIKSCDNVHKTIATLRYYLPPATIGQRGAGGSAEGRVTVTTAASVGACGHDWDLFLGDEAHELLADTYVAEIIRQTPEAIRYGFTATTTGRSDNADARMEVVFGRTIFRLPYPEAVGLHLVVPIEVHWHPLQLDRNPCAGFQDDVARERHGIWRNKARNRVVAEAMLEHFEAKEQSLVLVNKIEHALHLKRLLPAFTLCYGNLPAEDEELYARQGLLPDDYRPLTVGLRKQLREDFMAGKIRGAIATGVWRLGVSFNELAALFWAGAGSSPIDATQGPSRVSRINGRGKDIGVVHDIVDEWDAGYYNQSVARRRTYRKHDWTQVEPPGAFAARSGVGQYF